LKAAIVLASAGAIAAAPVAAELAARLGFHAGDQNLAVDVGEVAAAIQTTDDERVLVVLSLDDAPTAALERLTEGHLGKAMTVSLCGHALLRAYVVAPIGSGLVQMVLESESRAEAVMAVIRGDADCTALEERP
jgi:hypothetical protein